MQYRLYVTNTAWLCDHNVTSCHVQLHGDRLACACTGILFDAPLQSLLLASAVTLPRPVSISLHSIARHTPPHCAHSRRSHSTAQYTPAGLSGPLHSRLVLLLLLRLSIRSLAHLSLPLPQARSAAGVDRRLACTARPCTGTASAPPHSSQSHQRGIVHAMPCCVAHRRRTRRRHRSAVRARTTAVDCTTTSRSTRRGCDEWGVVQW